MKKFVMILAALTAAFAFASCERIENVAEDENVSKDYKVVINVADLDGDASTKSIKTSWKSGDIINIWYTDSYSANPVLRIRYDGTKWSLYGTDNPGYDILMELYFEGSSTRKKLLFCYESRNSLSYFKAPTYDSGYRERQAFISLAQIFRPRLSSVCRLSAQTSITRQRIMPSLTMMDICI